MKSTQFSKNGTVFIEKAHLSSLKKARRIAQTKLLSYRFSTLALALATTGLLITGGAVSAFAQYGESPIRQKVHALQEKMRERQTTVRVRSENSTTNSGSHSSNASVNNSIAISNKGTNWSGMNSNNNGDQKRIVRKVMRKDSDKDVNKRVTKKIIYRIVMPPCQDTCNYQPTPTYAPCDCYPDEGYSEYNEQPTYDHMRDESQFQSQSQQANMYYYPE